MECYKKLYWFPLLSTNIKVAVTYKKQQWTLPFASLQSFATISFKWRCQYMPLLCICFMSVFYFLPIVYSLDNCDFHEKNNKTLRTMLLSDDEYSCQWCIYSYGPPNLLSWVIMINSHARETNAKHSKHFVSIRIYFPSYDSTWFNISF